MYVRFSQNIAQDDGLSEEHGVAELYSTFASLDRNELEKYNF